MKVKMNVSTSIESMVKNQVEQMVYRYVKKHNDDVSSDEKYIFKKSIDLKDFVLKVEENGEIEFKEGKLIGIDETVKISLTIGSFDGAKNISFGADMTFEGEVPFTDIINTILEVAKDVIKIQMELQKSVPDKIENND